jgi:hypothetical protein
LVTLPIAGAISAVAIAILREIALWNASGHGGSSPQAVGKYVLHSLTGPGFLEVVPNKCDTQTALCFQVLLMNTIQCNNLL